MRYTTKDIEFLSETYGRQIDFRTHLDLIADHGRGARVEKSYSNGVVTERHHLVDGRVVTRHEGMPGTLYFVQEAVTPADLDRLTERVKEEVLRDIADGTVPATVSTFSELHDYVDANMYGDDDPAMAKILHDFDAGVLYINTVQDRVHEWLQAGGHRNG